MNSKLTSAAIAAAIFAFSSLSNAQTTNTREPSKTEPTEKTKSDVKQEKKKAEKKTEKEGEKAKTVPEKAVKKSDEAAKKLQEEVVGKKAQDENERRARQKRERVVKEERQAREAGEAVGRATTTAATAVVDTAQDVTRALDEPGKYNPIAATWNPLGLLAGRASFNIEYAPVTHHVIVVSPHFANPSQEVSVGPDTRFTNRYTGAGGEVGYRYYTGHKGMNGIFIGPSLIGGVYNAKLMAGDTRFANVGVAADLGFQQIFWDHLAVGAGVGLEYLHVTKDFGDLAAGPSTIASSGLKPRFLAQAGYAF